MGGGQGLTGGMGDPRVRGLLGSTIPASPGGTPATRVIQGSPPVVPPVVQQPMAAAPPPPPPGTETVVKTKTKPVGPPSGDGGRSTYPTLPPPGPPSTTDMGGGRPLMDELGSPPSRITQGPVPARLNDLRRVPAPLGAQPPPPWAESFDENGNPIIRKPRSPAGLPIPPKKATPPRPER
jgi:hypothetical protein